MPRSARSHRRPAPVAPPPMITTCVFSIRIGSASEFCRDAARLRRERFVARCSGSSSENRLEGKRTPDPQWTNCGWMESGEELSSLAKSFEPLIRSKSAKPGGLPHRTPSRTPFRAPKFCSLYPRTATAVGFSVTLQGSGVTTVRLCVGVRRAVGDGHHTRLLQLSVYQFVHRRGPSLPVPSMTQP